MTDYEKEMLANIKAIADSLSKYVGLATGELSQEKENSRNQLKERELDLREQEINCRLQEINKRDEDQTNLINDLQREIESLKSLYNSSN